MKYVVIRLYNMEVFLWLILIWVVALCPPIGFIIGILALLGAAIGSCFRR